MNNLVILFLVIASINQVYANYNKSIYDTDNRFDYHEIQNHKFLEMANSVAAFINVDKLINNADESVSLKTRLYGDYLNFCESERFTEQPTASTCTGFLIGDDLVATAGHCLFERKCEDQAIVFNYHAVGEENYRTELHENDVYYCKEVVLFNYTFFNPEDYAIIRLDRPVEGRTPFKLRASGNPIEGTPVMAISHPMGLPKKFSLNAEIKNVDLEESTIQTNLDVLGGSSGGPVINRETFEVEGIIASGPIDFSRDSEVGCFYSSRYGNDEEGTWGKSTSIKFITDFIENLE